MSLLARLAFVARRRTRLDHELDQEIAAHLIMAVEDRVARGEPRREAEIAVRREFGDPDLVKELTRSARQPAWLDRLRQDLAFGWRSLRRDPRFLWSAALVLTVAIGSNATVFTLADALLFSDAPGIAEPDALVGIRWIEAADDGADESVWGYPDYAYLRAEAAAFDGVLAYLAEPIAVTTSPDSGSQADAWIVSSNFFDVLGVPMALGRAFALEEGRAGTPAVAVVSSEFWSRRLNADPEVIGRTLPINGVPFTIVGVAAREFRGVSAIERAPDLYVPVTQQGAVIPGSESWLERVDGTSSGWLRLVARLAEGETVASAQASLASVQAGWAEAFGDWWATTERPEFRMTVTPEYRLDVENARRLRRMLGFLGAIVGVMLVIGSANVAILLLARGAARRDEIALRAALGARRSRLFAQLSIESLFLGAAAGLAGCLFAAVAARVLVPLLPYPLAGNPAAGAALPIFVAAVAFLATLLFGIVPAERLSRADPMTALRRSRRATGGNGVRNALVVGQIAAALVILAAAGLFVRSIVAAQSVDLGFEPAGRLVLAANLAVRDYDAERARAFVDGVLARARALPGVERASVAARAPFSGRTDEGVRLPGRSDSDGPFVVNFNWVGPGYFETLGLALVAGRAIEARDTGDAAGVVVVNETTADRLWPGGRAVGRELRWKNRAWTVVGVAADANYYALGEAPTTQVYVPMAQDYNPRTTFLLETAAPPESLIRPLEDAIRELDPELTVFDARPLADIVDAQASTYRLLAVVGGAFGLIGLVLTVAGLYGVQSYLVAQRFKEIGIRMAMGAGPGHVSSHVIRHGGLLAGIGVAIGLPIALALQATIEGLLFGVQAEDPVTFAAVVALLFATSLAASYLPARRASRTDPMVALRND